MLILSVPRRLAGADAIHGLPQFPPQLDCGGLGIWKSITSKGHVSHILAKLVMKNRAQLALYVERNKDK